MNPYWVKEQWYNLLYEYIQLTYQEILAFITDDYTRLLDIFDQLKAQTTLIGDYQARGIMRSLSQVPPDMSQPAESTWVSSMHAENK